MRPVETLGPGGPSTYSIITLDTFKSLEASNGSEVVPGLLILIPVERTHQKTLDNDTPSRATDATSDERNTEDVANVLRHSPHISIIKTKYQYEYDTTHVYHQKTFRRNY